MKRALVTVAILFAACASSSGPEVWVHLEQLTSNTDFRFGGPVNIRYRVTITNETDAPVTLTRIELRTVGGGGAYVLREPSIPQHLAVGPKSSAGVDVIARGTAIGGNAAAAEPVTVRAIAYLDGPTGAFTRIVNETFAQLGRE